MKKIDKKKLALRREAIRMLRRDAIGGLLPTSNEHTCTDCIIDQPK